MKRFALPILLLMIPFVVLAGDRTRTFVNRVTAGSLSVTNAYSAGGDGTASTALELKRVSFTLADCTNTFSINHIIRYKLPGVETNIAVSTPIAYTNTYWYEQGTVDYTNVWSASETESVTNLQVFDRDDFGDGFMWEWQEIMQFKFSYTNNPINLRRVYTEYPRP